MMQLLHSLAPTYRTDSPSFGQHKQTNKQKQTREVCAPHWRALSLCPMSHTMLLLVPACMPRPPVTVPPPVNSVTPHTRMGIAVKMAYQNHDGPEFGLRK